MLMVKSCLMLISSLCIQNSWSLTISLKLVLSAHYPRADAAKLTVLFTVSDGSQLLKSVLRAPKRHIQNLSELSYSFTFPCSCHKVLSCCTPLHQHHLYFFSFSCQSSIFEWYPVCLFAVSCANQVSGMPGFGAWVSSTLTLWWSHSLIYL